MAAPLPAKQTEITDDGTDMTEMERKVREAVAEGLLPGVSKLVPVGDGIKKLDIAILDVKPWDDETDMAELENKVREIVADGLLWGVAKLVPIGFGINKLRIAAVIEEDKVSTDWLVETIEELEDFVQSVDIAAFHKV